jgi:hypothetical protein
MFLPPYHYLQPTEEKNKLTIAFISVATSELNQIETHYHLFQRPTSNTNTVAQSLVSIISVSL